MSSKEAKETINCYSAMDKLAACASRLIRGTKSTPGFCSQNIEERLQSGHHAAMDFSAGCGGRIISDPAEAAIIAKTSCRLRSLPMSASPGLGSSKSSLETVFDPNQDVSLTGCSEAWFQPNMGREQANSLLFPHRHSDGHFLIRACSRQVNNYVLSFTSNGKIVHAQIIRISHGGKNAFSLDGAKTKFPSLEHLVNFYKMNSGPLPTLLKDCVNVSSVLPSPRNVGARFKEFNNNGSNKDSEHLHQELEHEGEGSPSFS